MDELAERGGVHRTYIGLLERRSRRPTLAVAANLAEALGSASPNSWARRRRTSATGSSRTSRFLSAAPEARGARHLGEGCASPASRS